MSMYLSRNYQTNEARPSTERSISASPSGWWLQGQLLGPQAGGDGYTPNMFTCIFLGK